MGMAFLMALAAGLLGWRRAARRGGTRGDRWQYAAAHAFPTFLVVMILLTIGGHLGLFELF